MKKFKQKFETVFEKNGKISGDEKTYCFILFYFIVFMISFTCSFYYLTFKGYEVLVFFKIHNTIK